MENIIKTGDIVEIKNAYFKNDNGLYFVKASAGDAFWFGNDYSLCKIGKSGKISTAKNKTAFYPLMCCTNDRMKNAIAREHNEKHATIEIVTNINNSFVIEYFKNKVTEAEEQYNYYFSKWGNNAESERLRNVLEDYKKVVERLTEEETKPTAETITEVTEEPTEEAQQETNTTTEEQKEVKTMERKYFTINEDVARTAHTINSFREYAKDNATHIYRAYCDSVYDVVEKIEAQKPALAERALYMAERYCRKLADYYNAYYRNEASCPSLMICGAGNFPTRKKQKQNSRRDSLMNEWNYLQSYAKKIENLLTNNQAILSSDADAMERLQDKIEDLEKTKELMKDLNKHFRNGGTIEEYDGEITEKLKSHIDFMIRQGWQPQFDTTNTNAEIKRLKGRLEQLQRVKEEGTTEATTADDDGNELFTVVKNTEIMRLQLIFDGKPEDAVRDILKKNGFKWSPKNGAWQRQLTDNALFSLKRVTEAIKAIA